ncbi:PREDICTED: protein KASH5 [Condylura cristata]|uniref:protein KASH5 n=1 Tax=Condylura cristata TaxID=143302 RepID=UPI000642D20F|nr:PREDICTED: protein KASH5 [Condylura cristata]
MEDERLRISPRLPSAPLRRPSPPCPAVYLWDQPEEGGLGMLLSLEEQVLNSTFQACDPQKTGTVTVTHVLAYLEAVTGRGPQDARLQTLACSLDPNGEGPKATVDLDTFLVVMRDWIAACQLDGGLELQEETVFEGALTSQQVPSGCPEAEEPASLESFGGEDPRTELPATADLLSSLQDLELGNRRLARENAKLQRSAETAEEGAARLGEELLALRKQLRSTQQALQFAKAVGEELEDLKTLAKSLEDQNRGLLAQARQAEKEHQQLVAEIQTLQEENGKLLAERDGVKKRSEELATEKDALKRQLRECESLICQREAVLCERTRHAENLAKTLEEYRATTQVTQPLPSSGRPGTASARPCPAASRQLLSASLPPLPSPSAFSWPSRPEKQLLWQQEVAALGLGSPLCGVWQWEDAVSEAGEDAAPPPEAPQGGHPAALTCSPPQRRGQAESEGRKEQLMCCRPRLPAREEEEAGTLVLADLPMPQGATHPGDGLESPESTAQPELRGALVPVVKELVAARSPVWSQLKLQPQPPQRLRVTRHLLIPTPVLGLLLLLLLSVVLLGQSPPPSWPHLQLYYLQPPPV